MTAIETVLKCVTALGIGYLLMMGACVIAGAIHEGGNYDTR